MNHYYNIFRDETVGVFVAGLEEEIGRYGDIISIVSPRLILRTTLEIDNTEVQIVDNLECEA